MHPLPPKGPARRAPGVTAPTSANAVDTLLRDLGTALQRGSAVEPARQRCATGLAPVDRLLGGGFPRGRLSEIAGPASCGRTSLALGLLAQTTYSGKLAALIDAEDAFDPTSAEDFGVQLDRVLWARPRSAANALRCAECLLQTEGFPLVLLDLTASTQTRGHVPWIRLARLAASTRTALIVLSNERVTGSQAEVALAMQPVQARFRGTPSLLESLETSAVLVRHRAIPGEGEVTIQWAGSSAA